MADRVALALGREAAIRKAERRVERAVVQAMTDLASMAVAALDESGMDESVLDLRWPDWFDTVAQTIEPVIEQVYLAAYEEGPLTAAGEAASATAPAAIGASNHLAGVRNRLVGVGDGVFDLIRATLDEGRAAEEDVRQLGKRVDATLAEQGQQT